MEKFIALLEDSIKHLDDPIYPDGEESRLNKAGAAKVDASNADPAGLPPNMGESPLVRHSLLLQAMASLLCLKLRGTQYQCSFMHSIDMCAMAWKPGQQSSRQPHDTLGAAGLDVPEGGRDSAGQDKPGNGQGSGQDV